MVAKVRIAEAQGELLKLPTRNNAAMNRMWRTAPKSEHFSKATLKVKSKDGQRLAQPVYTYRSLRALRKNTILTIFADAAARVKQTLEANAKRVRESAGKKYVEKFNKYPLVPSVSPSLALAFEDALTGFVQSAGMRALDHKSHTSNAGRSNADHMAFGFETLLADMASTQTMGAHTAALDDARQIAEATAKATRKAKAVKKAKSAKSA